MSVYRCADDGWYLCAMHDPAGRRGLWYCYAPENAAEHLVRRPPPLTAVALCAGREGDAAYVRFAVGETVTPDMLADLVDCLSRAESALHDAEEHREWQVRALERVPVVHPALAPTPLTKGATSS